MKKFVLSLAPFFAIASASVSPSEAILSNLQQAAVPNSINNNPALQALSNKLDLQEDQKYLRLYAQHLADHKLQRDVESIAERYQIFKATAKQVHEHNAKPDKTYTLAVYPFADLTPAEFTAQYLGHREPDPSEIVYDDALISSDDLVHSPETNEFTLKEEKKVALASKGHAVKAQAFPTYLNWNTTDNPQNIVASLGIVDQGGCGSCWAFASTAALEGAYALNGYPLRKFSEQNIVSCSFQGCAGGNLQGAYGWMKTYGGICSGADYPYVSGRNGLNGECMNTCQPIATNIGYLTPRNESYLMAALNIGPVVIGVAASCFGPYKSGILDNPDCTAGIDHDITAIGYGTENGVDYWLAKNQWGTWWGDKGYIRFRRMQNALKVSVGGMGYPLVTPAANVPKTGITYKWVPIQRKWSQCVAPRGCGNGTQTASYQCVDSNGLGVAQAQAVSKCGAFPATAAVQSCWIPCTFEWRQSCGSCNKVTNYSDCAVSCWGTYVDPLNNVAQSYPYDSLNCSLTGAPVPPDHLYCNPNPGMCENELFNFDVLKPLSFMGSNVYTYQFSLCSNHVCPAWKASTSICTCWGTDGTGGCSNSFQYNSSDPNSAVAKTIPAADGGSNAWAGVVVTLTDRNPSRLCGGRAPTLAVTIHCNTSSGAGLPSTTGVKLHGYDTCDYTMDLYMNCDLLRYADPHPSAYVPPDRRSNGCVSSFQNGMGLWTLFLLASFCYMFSVRL